MNIITVKDLRKEYTVKEWKGLLRRKTKRIEALKGISFKVKKGEILGYLGENGSGKSTTLKILTGILHPSSGKAKVLGFVPWEERMEYTKHIGVVFGQKSALWWDLPVKDSLDFWASIYNVPREEHEEVLGKFGEILGLEEIINQPVRKLSFGQRMKAELMVSIIHSPDVIFLDEPTIGLDVLIREKVREFLTKLNREMKATIILTTHELQDVEALCNRTILLHKGEIVFDGEMKELKRKYGNTKEFEIEFKPSIRSKIREMLSRYGVKVMEREFAKASIPKSDEKELAEKVLALGDNVISFNIKEPSLEEVVRGIYAESE